MNCHFCQSEIDKHYICNICPYKVIYYSNEQLDIYALEIEYKEYIISIHLKDFYAGDVKFFISDINNLSTIMRLNENPGITPYNIEQKLPLLLTFQ